MACFADINVSQGSVATYATRGGIFDIHLTANLPRNLPVKNKFLNRFRIDRITFMSLWPRFLAHPVYLANSQLSTAHLYFLVSDENVLGCVLHCADCI